MTQETSANERPFPRATYRLQLNGDFGFLHAAERAPYLAGLGVSHVYLSPIFAARPGSNHGYDGTDHSRLNPELGSEEDFRAMIAAFQENGLGTILDFVPNHMGISGASNDYWLSVMEWGPESPHAARFDIDWSSPYPGLTGKVLFPFLGESLGDVLESGGLRLAFDPEKGEFSVWAHDTHRLPICPRHYGALLDLDPRCTVLAQALHAAGRAGADKPIWTELKRKLVAAHAEDPRFAGGIEAIVSRHNPEKEAGRQTLLELIDRQFWRAAKHNLAADAINYRRFFAVSDLAAIRIENESVFDEVHGLILSLLEQGAIDGIRIDHIDGLADPKEYTLRLRDKAARPFYLLVEKILAPDEELPESWQTDGTTGYEFGNLLIGLLVNPAAGEDLGQIYENFTGRTEEPEAIVHACKRAILSTMMAAELEALASRFHALADADASTRDLGRHSIERALAETIAAFGVYRTYAARDGLPPEDRPRIETAIAEARAALPDLEAGAFDFIASILTLDLRESRPSDANAIVAAACRFQQLSGPVMAKGLEDTALYRYNRLIALNEVGSEPGAPLVTPDAFHAANAKRLEREPRAMLTTSTHDTKRGEDARTKIAALSYHRDTWERAIAEWHELLHDPRAPLDPNEEYFFYQLLLGAWPGQWRRDIRISADQLEELRGRVTDAMLKSVREASVNTRWIQGSDAYEEALCAFIDRAVSADPANRFLPAFRTFEARLFPDATFLSEAQTVLKLTVPGVPDIYRGAELWEQSLVDPDNRRPVDFDLCERLLKADPPEQFANPSGHGKLHVTRNLLRLRREFPELFARGSYRPIAEPEDAGSRIAAFRRVHGKEELIVAVSLPPRSSASDLGTLIAGASQAPAFQDVLHERRIDRGDLAPTLTGQDIVVLLART